MPNLKCSVDTCTYNYSSACHKSNIMVEGLIARSKTNTFCNSYRKLNPYNAYDVEFSSFNDLDEEKDIYCDAISCVHLKENKCNYKGQILIDGKKALSQSETNCNTFKLK